MKALIETTIFADALLKTIAERRAAKAAISGYQETFAPVYAFKELKAGALKNFVWFHNKLALFSFSDALKALHSSALTPRKYRTATAIEALRAAVEAVGAPQGWAEKYGAKSSDAMLVYTDRLRLTLKRIIKQGWSSRRKLTTHVICELPCYPETPLTDLGDLTLEIEPIKCDVKGGCELARIMSADPKLVKMLLKSVEAAEDKNENTRRARALRKILKEGWKTFTDQDCKALGDAAFVFLAPQQATVLTTNLRDIEPLATAVGKTAHRP